MIVAAVWLTKTQPIVVFTNKKVAMSPTASNVTEENPVLVVGVRMNVPDPARSEIKTVNNCPATPLARVPARPT